jgi:hypothetical protein
LVRSHGSERQTARMMRIAITGVFLLAGVGLAALLKL